MSCRARWRAATENLVLYLDHIARAYGRQGTRRSKHAPYALKLRTAGWKDLPDRTHEFISGFIVDNNRLGATIGEQYLI